jgi:hypothetical protein
VSRQRKVKAKASASADEEARPATPDERGRDEDDPGASFRRDPTIPRDFVGPPLDSKTNPREAMDDTLPSLDDERRRHRHHPSESEAIEFEIDPLAGDAAADLAADFGSQFLEGATRGEDLGSRVLALDDDSDAPLDLLLDEDEEQLSGDEATIEVPRRARSTRRRKAG